MCVSVRVCVCVFVCVHACVCVWGQWYICIYCHRENIGFPVVEFDGSGDQFVLTKPPNTGGLVTVAVAAEQVRQGCELTYQPHCIITDAV